MGLGLPHGDGVWPESSKYIEEQFGHLPPATVGDRLRERGAPLQLRLARVSSLSIASRFLAGEGEAGRGPATTTVAGLLRGFRSSQSGLLEQ